MFHTISHEGNANKIHSEAPLHNHYNGYNKNIENDKSWEGCGGIDTFIHYWWEFKVVQLIWKTVWQSLKKLNVEFIIWSTIPLQGIYSEELKTSTQTTSGSHISIAALPTIVKMWIAQMSISGLMDKQNVVCTFNGMFFSLKRRKSTCYNTDHLENFMLSQKGQTQKVTCCMIPLIWKNP